MQRQVKALWTNWVWSVAQRLTGSRQAIYLSADQDVVMVGRRWRSGGMRALADVYAYVSVDAADRSTISDRCAQLVDRIEGDSESIARLIARGNLYRIG
jgi:hypothetical protein